MTDSFLWSFNMDLVTVTCLKDYRQMVQQAESIGKFLNPCTHWVVVNETQETFYKNESLWKNHLSDFYSNHDLRVIFPELNEPEYDPLEPYHNWPNSYNRQQVLKFWISKHINDDYLILDTKNFFIKNCSIDDWNQVYGSGLMQSYYEFGGKWIRTTEAYADFLGQDILKEGYLIETPFVFRKKTLEKLGNIEKFCANWIDLHVQKDILFSEFMLYSYLEKEKFEKLTNDRLNQTIWEGPTQKITDLFNLINNKKIVSTGIHKDVLTKLTDEDKTVVIEFLKKLDLTNYLV